LSRILHGIDKNGDIRVGGISIPKTNIVKSLNNSFTIPDNEMVFMVPDFLMTLLVSSKPLFTSIHSLKYLTFEGISAT